MKYGKKLKALAAEWQGRDMPLMQYGALKKLIKLVVAAGPKSGEEHKFFSQLYTDAATTQAVYSAALMDIERNIELLEQQQQQQHLKISKPAPRPIPRPPPGTDAAPPKKASSAAAGVGGASSPPPTVKDVREDVRVLQEYLVLQKEGFRKIVKKLDKKTGSAHLVGFLQSLQTATEPSSSSSPLSSPPPAHPVSGMGFLWGSPLTALFQRLDLLEASSTSSTHPTRFRALSTPTASAGSPTPPSSPIPMDRSVFADAKDLEQLDAWNLGSAPYPETACLHDLFYKQAKATPDAVALVDGTTSLTYRELDDITDRLASQLFHEFGVRPDSVVGLFMERSAEYVVSYIAALKAGGAYMPLELVYPAGLLDRALQQTSASVVITKSRYAVRLPAGFPTVVLDSAVDDAPAYSDTVPPIPAEGLSPRPGPDNLGFVVMSSGTTGTPKGICQVHRSAVHSYWDRARRYPYVASDRVGAGVFFVWELLRPLLEGATCVVIPDDVIFDPEAVTRFIRDQGITRVLFTPSLLQLVMDTVPQPDIAARLAGLRIMWLCGEVVTVDLAVSFSRLVPDTELLNLYSISECHDVTIGDLRRELDTSREYATCGRNIPNVRLYVVEFEDDARTVMRRVKVGETGEVFVGGPVLAREYLGMPEKTAERFVPSPFGDPVAPRLYRTGDLGRILPDGSLEIVGRCDHMVKIRGYSVVLGAVEAALAKHPKLASAIVLTVGAEGTDKRLVAYVVPLAWDSAPSAASVRTFLKDHLPPYAIPGTFCIISALPVAASAAGKVDRKKLPDVESAPRLRAFSGVGVDVDEEGRPIGGGDGDGDGAAAGSGGRVAPSGRFESMTLDVWVELLGTPADELSVTDSFFDVGGHSLLATRMVTKLNDAFEVASGTVTLADVMMDPSVRTVARLYADAAATPAPCGGEPGPDPKSSSSSSSSSGAASGGAGSAAKAGGGGASSTIDLHSEAAALDPSVYPAATRKAVTVSRVRLERMLFRPRVVFLTGATGWLGAHILAEILISAPDVTCVCLVRAGDVEAGMARLRHTLEKFKLLDLVFDSMKKGLETEDVEVEVEGEEAAAAAAVVAGGVDDGDHIDDPWLTVSGQLVPVTGDLSKPLLGLDPPLFKSLAAEIDSIIHCGAAVNLVKPYAALKLPNVLGTQEVLRLATTNGLLRTAVKPVHYVSTNGIFPLTRAAYPSASDSDVVVAGEDARVDDPAFTVHLTEGYGMTKWVAERMCGVARERGLLASILRPGNMAGSSVTGVQNPDDFVYLFLKGVLDLGAAPDADMGDAYAFDLTPVDFAAAAVVALAIQKPTRVVGRRVHLQNSRPPVSLATVTTMLRDIGHRVESVDRDTWVKRLEAATADGVDAPQHLLQLRAGFTFFEHYFRASTWLQYGSTNLTAALAGTGVTCPAVEEGLLKLWFPAGVC